MSVVELATVALLAIAAEAAPARSADAPPPAPTSNSANAVKLPPPPVTIAKNPAPQATRPAPPAPAVAGWQYARWGMSPAEVVAASNGAARLIKPSSDTNTVFGSAKADAQYRQDPFLFYVTFIFRYDKLTEVVMHEQGKRDCSPIMYGMLNRYGRLPVIKSANYDTTLFAWSNTPIATDIRLWMLPQGCGILYIQHGVVPAKKR